MCASFNAKYRVLDKIGEGSFSEVLRCQDRQSGLLYAAKRLKRVYRSVEEILDSAELMATRKISRHPNVLCVLETYHEVLPGRASLVFELMDMSLYELMRERKGRPMMEARVKSYVYQLLKGIEHLHKHGLFHRDIKPENILLKSGRLKVGDLGSVPSAESRPPHTEYISTRWYRSPECLLTAGFYGPKMDLWAAGCVFYELLSLEPLFPGENELDQVSRIHRVLGAPQPRLLAKFRRRDAGRSGPAAEWRFPEPRREEARGLVALLPRLSAAGLEALRMMLAYDPDRRAAAASLLGHRYFADLRLREPIKQTRSSTAPGCPSLFGYLQQRGFQLASAARTVESTPNARMPARLDHLGRPHVDRYLLRKRPSNLRLNPELRKQPPEDNAPGSASSPGFFSREHRAPKASRGTGRLPSIFLKPNLKILTSTYVLDDPVQSFPSTKLSSIGSPLKKMPRRDHSHRRLRLIQ